MLHSCWYYDSDCGSILPLKKIFNNCMELTVGNVVRGSSLDSNSIPGGQQTKAWSGMGKGRGLSLAGLQKTTRSLIKPDQPKMAGVMMGKPWPNREENTCNSSSMKSLSQVIDIPPTYEQLSIEDRNPIPTEHSLLSWQCPFSHFKSVLLF